MKKVNIDQYGGFDIEGLTKEEIECVDDALSKYDSQDGKEVTSVTLDRNSITVSVRDIDGYGYGGLEENDEDGDLADFDTQED